MRRTIVTALFAVAWPLSAAPVKIHGYVTSISTAKSFAIDKYRITRDDKLVFEVDKGDYPDAAFRPEDLRVGTELEVQGEFNEVTHELCATGIKVFFGESFRVKRSAVIEHASVLEREGAGWKGIIHADGETIRVDEQTHFALKDGQTNHLVPGYSITYEGRRERDGSIAATRLEMFSNVAGKGELKLRHDLIPKLNEDGEIAIGGMKYKLTPDAEAQSYVQRVGTQLVPVFYQQDLSGGAARRLTFQFYLVDSPDFNAHAFPNGVVLVNKGVFQALTTEAQLAAVLGHEIAHATQEHTIRDLQHQKKSPNASAGDKGYTAGAKGDAQGNGYSRSLENQADRVGLEYMVAAGYDAREAAEVWAHAARLTGDSKSLWNGWDDSTSRRSYLLAELHNNYSAIDFQSYVRDREEFDILAARFGNTAITRTGFAPSAGTAAATRPGYRKSDNPGTQASRASSSREQPGAPYQQTYSTNAVTINSDPEGADVVMNGAVIGMTPMTLPTGVVGIPFVLTVQKAGYLAWTGQLVSVPGRTTLRVDLLPVR